MKNMKKSIAGVLVAGILVTGCSATPDNNKASAQNIEQEQESTTVIPEGLKEVKGGTVITPAILQYEKMSIKELQENEKQRMSKYQGRFEIGVTSADPYNWNLPLKTITKLEYGKLDFLTFLERFHTKFPKSGKQKEALNWVHKELVKELPGFDSEIVTGEQTGKKDSIRFTKGKNSIDIHVYDTNDGYELQMYVDGVNNEIQNLILDAYEELPKDRSEGTPDTNVYESDKYSLWVETTYYESLEKFQFRIIQDNELMN